MELIFKVILTTEKFSCIPESNGSLVRSGNYLLWFSAKEFVGSIQVCFKSILHGSRIESQQSNQDLFDAAMNGKEIILEALSPDVAVNSARTVFWRDTRA